MTNFTHILLLAFLCTMMFSGGAAVEGADRGSGSAKTGLRVVKYGDNVFIRSAFSAQEDLVVRVEKGANNHQINFFGAFLLNESAGMSEKEVSNGRMIHGNGDDATPWNINGTYIGANHGCSDSRDLTCADHGRTAADLGSEWTDEAGHKFYLIKIADKDHLWFLPENTGKGAVWKFANTYSGSTLKCAARRATITFADNRMVQLHPACRIRKQEYLIEGKKPLQDGKPASCDYLDIVEEYDIISPASLLEDIVKHPGVERDFTGDKLDGVISNHIVYRFHPNGANVIYYTAKALQEFNIGYMGFIQSAKLTKGDYDAHVYYIPKTTPFTRDDIAYDFKSMQDYSSPPKSPLRFTEASKNIEDPKNLPDRFIQLLGRKEDGKVSWEVGYALGYSLVRGLTKPAERAKNASAAITLHTTAKSYPVAIDSQMEPLVPAGTKFDCIAYRQYFRPADQKAATCFYWHEEDGEVVVYADYHKAVDRDILKLPAALTGKTITLIEKTPSLTLRKAKSVPAGGVTVSVTGNYGYVVFKVKAK
ncbi:MAG: hypothetical protein AB1696_06940 [Planctomycetota bacterium]